MRVIVQSLIALVMLAGVGVAYTHFYGAPFGLKLPWVDAGMAAGPVAAAGGGQPGGFAIPVEIAQVNVGPIQRRLLRSARCARTSW